MRVTERILLALSRSPEEGDYAEAVDAGEVGEALDSLRRYFPDLSELVRGRRVLDFGCGSGRQSLALVSEGAELVVGFDINEKTLASARSLAAEGVGVDRLRFVDHIPAELLGTFDVVITLNSMEHFADPEAVLVQMRAALRPGGRILVSFDCPWLSPYGSHMHFFTRVPWVNILFSERTVMAVRGRFRSDGATRYEEVESGLNRMTVGRFERIAAQSGTRMDRRLYRCIKGLDFLGKLPLARELFINHVSCVLESPAPPATRAASPR